MKTKDLVLQAFIAGIYTALSLGFHPLTYGPIQIRFAEITLLLLLINRKHAWGIIIGCLITNLYSPLGMVDVVFGTLATAITCYLMVKTDNDVLKLLWPAIVNGLIVGGELTVLFKEFPFILNMLYVAAGEIIAVFIPGILLKSKIRKNQILQSYFG